MPAYAISIQPQICWCGKKATLEVYNSKNSKQGAYCTVHGAQKVKDTN